MLMLKLVNWYKAILEQIKKLKQVVAFARVKDFKTTTWKSNVRIMITELSSYVYVTTYKWPNFGKLTISSCMKQLEFLCLTWYYHEHRMLFEYFWDLSYNFMYLECIQPTIA